MVQLGSPSGQNDDFFGLSEHLGIRVTKSSHSFEETQIVIIDGAFVSIYMYVFKMRVC